MGSLDDLLVVQTLDTRIDQLHHRQKHSPERDAVASATTALAQVRQQSEIAERRLHDLKANEKALEDEAVMVEEHAADVQRKLYDGTISAAKELEAFQADHDMLKRRQAEIEDRAIEILEVAEPIEAEAVSLRASVTQHGEALADAESRLTVAEAEIAAELEQVAADRRSAAAGLPPEIVAAYEPLRAQLGGVGAARLSGGRCEGCHLELPSAQLASVRRAEPEALITCPECGRLLVR